MTDSKDIRRLRGAAELLSDAVEHGASAIERVHLATAARPFAVLENIAPTALVARGVHVAHDVIAQSVYGSIRAVTRLARVAVTTAIDVAGDATSHADETNRAHATIRADATPHADATHADAPGQDDAP
jgi:hypothetical protein